MNSEDRVNGLRKHVFFEILNETGRVMILVRYSPDVMIGKRGFTEDEIKTGLTLVFTDRMKFSWDEAGISASLSFGASVQSCFIPGSSIAAVYSPEMRVQLFTAVAETGGDTVSGGAEKTVRNISEGNVISVDFVGRKRVPREEGETEDS
jgi:hypothetical protein